MVDQPLPPPGTWREAAGPWERLPSFPTATTARRAQKRGKVRSEQYVVRTRLLTPSLPLSLSHSLTHSLARSLTHSLTHLRKAPMELAYLHDFTTHSTNLVARRSPTHRPPAVAWPSLSC